MNNIKDTHLSTRAKNALQRNGIFTVRQMREVLNSGKLGSLDGIGPVVVEEAKRLYGVDKRDRCRDKANYGGCWSYPNCSCKSMKRR